jgi:DNA polymerase-3 subunit beta
MKLSCLQENLVQGIQLVGHIALRATALPVLKNVLLKTENGVLNVSATNLESGIVHSVRGKIEEDGECLIPAKLLTELVPLLPPGKLELELKEDGLLVKTEQSESTLRIVPVEDFPVIPDVSEDTTEIKIGCDLLKSMFQQTVVAVGRVEQRPQFSGVYLKTNKDNLVLVATDGFRLSESSVMLLGAITGECSVIIPTATVQEVVRALGMQNNEELIVSVVVNENQIQFRLGSTVITSRVIEGDYPDYEPLFPKEDGSHVIVSATALARAIKATALFSKAGMTDVSLELPSKAGGVIVFSENGDVGAYRTEVPGEGVGENVSVVLNARYLQDGVNVLPGDGVKLKVVAGDRPVMVEPVEESPINSRYLVMPIRR